MVPKGRKVGRCSTGSSGEGKEDGQDMRGGSGRRWREVQLAAVLGAGTGEGWLEVEDEEEDGTRAETMEDSEGKEDRSTISCSSSLWLSLCDVKRRKWREGGRDGLLDLPPPPLESLLRSDRTTR
jgi:hypothetical protein